jgi:hypothetical protein
MAKAENPRKAGRVTPCAPFVAAKRIADAEKKSCVLCVLSRLKEFRAIRVFRG